MSNDVTSRWGVALGKVLGAPEALAAGVHAEELGYSDVWVSNERFHRDMFTVLGALATRTERVELGTFVTDPYTVHPAISATAVATIDQLSGGRAMFAIGAGGSGFPEMGLGGTKPLRDVAETIAISRAMFAGETATAGDAAFVLRDAHLAELPVREVPIIVASQSPKMLELGGRSADAVMISTFADPRLFSMAVEWAAEGAAAAGRDFDVATDVIARIDVAVDADRGAARDRLRPLIGYLMVLLHPKWWFLDVIGVEVSDELTDIAARRDFAAMRERLDLLPDELIDAFGWCGSADDVAAGAARLEELGVRRFVVLPHARPGGFVDTIEQVAARALGVGNP